MYGRGAVSSPWVPCVDLRAVLRTGFAVGCFSVGILRQLSERFLMGLCVGGQRHLARHEVRHDPQLVCGPALAHRRNDLRAVLLEVLGKDRQHRLGDAVAVSRRAALANGVSGQREVCSPTLSISGGSRSGPFVGTTC
jgi:hypothetical protein